MTPPQKYRIRYEASNSGDYRELRTDLLFRVWLSAPVRREIKSKSIFKAKEKLILNRPIPQRVIGAVGVFPELLISRQRRQLNVRETWPSITWCSETDNCLLITYIICRTMMISNSSPFTNFISPCCVRNYLCEGKLRGISWTLPPRNICASWSEANACCSSVHSIFRIRSLSHPLQIIAPGVVSVDRLVRQGIFNEGETKMTLPEPRQWTLNSSGDLFDISYRYEVV